MKASAALHAGISFGVCFVILFAGDARAQDKNYLLGKFDPATDQRFTRIKNGHASGSAEGGYLRSEAYQAFERMYEAAKKDGVHIVIVSATRTFESQKQIWENKWSGRTIVEGKNLTTIKDPVARARTILRYSSMPGSSRHHWGTDMDLNSLENSYFEAGPGLKMYRWLLAHASEYGFCQPYTSKSKGRTGYEEEKWHWSYEPLSTQLLSDYLLHIQYEDIAGFSGSETAKPIRIIDEYVKGVDCAK